MNVWNSVWILTEVYFRFDFGIGRSLLSPIALLVVLCLSVYSLCYLTLSSSHMSDLLFAYIRVVSPGQIPAYFSHLTNRQQYC